MALTQRLGQFDDVDKEETLGDRRLPWPIEMPEEG